MTRTGSLVSIFVLVHLIAISSHADPSEDRKVVVLMKGKPAPYSGILVPEARFKEFLNLEVTVEDLRYRLDLQTKMTNDIEKLLMVKLGEGLKPTPWYERPSLNRWMGFAIGVAATGFLFWGGIEFIDRI